MELLICIDALRRASAKRITAVVPISAMPGRTVNPARARRSRPSWSPILITKPGADRVLAVDLHAGQIQGFFDIPTDNLYARR
jgi:ribose-phosphate pyrophosphokinase